MWLSSNVCPSRPSKMVAIRPPPSPLRHFCLVVVCHGDAITRYVSLPKDTEASVAPCLANCKAGPGPAGFIWDSLEITSVLTFICHRILKTFPLCCWLAPLYPGSSPSAVEEDLLSQGCSGLMAVSEPFVTVGCMALTA